MQNYETESFWALKQKGYSKEDSVKIVDNDKKVRLANKEDFFLIKFKKGVSAFRVDELFSLKLGAKSIDEIVKSLKYNGDETFTVTLSDGKSGIVENERDLFCLVYKLNEKVFPNAEYELSMSGGFNNLSTSIFLKYPEGSTAPRNIEIVVKPASLDVKHRHQKGIKVSLKDVSDLQKYLVANKAS